MFYLIFERINPSTRIGVSNLKDEIEKATLAKFGNNVKDLLDNMSSNNYIIKDKGEIYEGFVKHIFRDLLQGQTQHSIVSLKRLGMIETQ